MHKADRILGGVLLLLALISLGEGLRTWDKIGGTGFMPAIIGSIFGLLGLVLLFRRPPLGKDQPNFWSHQAGWRRIGLTIMTFFLYILAVPPIGYAMGTVVFLMVLFRIMGNIRWEKGFLYGMVASVSTYIIFKVWLNMPLPAGFLGY
jgi:hypothetical protein